MKIPMEKPSREPRLNKGAFDCPFCHAFSNFHWLSIDLDSENHVGLLRDSYKAALCNHCKKWTLWIYNQLIDNDHSCSRGSLIYPFKLTTPLPGNDLPESCKKDYEEARKVFPFSLRASAALLRLCIQKLCKKFGGKGKDIDKDIGELVKKGLDERIKKALDIVRVSGNSAVHPGVMNIDDDEELVSNLFVLVNMIVDEMITKPKELEKLHDKLPKGAVDAIARRGSQEKNI